MQGSYSSFQDFKTNLIIWLHNNPHAVQLDDSTTRKSNPKQIVKICLSEISASDPPAAYLHGDVTRAALQKIIAKVITDFIIVPPASDNEQWRFHFADTHGYSNETQAAGLYTDLDKSGQLYVNLKRSLMQQFYKSFTDFKKDLHIWLANNPNAVQLDGSTIPTPNPQQIVKICLSRISESDSPAAYLHADT